MKDKAMNMKLSGTYISRFLLLVLLSAPVVIFGQQKLENHLIISEYPRSSKQMDFQNIFPDKAFELIPFASNNKIGQQHNRYQIQWKGIPLKGLQLTHHILANIERVISPTHIPSVQSLQSYSAKMDIDQIRFLARQQVPAEVYGDIDNMGAENDEVRLVFVPKKYDWTQKEWLLAYEVDVKSMAPLQFKRVTLDASTGDLIFIENKICSSHDHSGEETTEGTAVTKYHGIRTIETKFNGAVNEYYLIDETRGEGIHTKKVPPGAGMWTTIEYRDTDNYWDNVNEDQDEVAGDVQWGSAATWDFLKEKFNRNGYDGEGSGLLNRIRQNYAGASWIGSSTFYGTGFPNSSLDLPLTYIDIIAHEISHGVTQSTSNLFYANESGGLNEAFSDIMGVSVEHAILPDSVNWKLGEQSSSSGYYLRDMADPKSLEMPNTYGGEYWLPELEVHTGSSIANFWYYLLVEGGSGENDNNYNYNVEGIGWEDALQIVYHTWTNYLQSNSNYRQCADLSILAATDLFPACSPQILAVAEAWRAVGLLPPISSSIEIIADKENVCTLNEEVAFKLNFDVEEILWDFGDGTTSTELAPVHIYQNNGNYAFSASGISCENGPFNINGAHEIAVEFGSGDCSIITIAPNESRTVNYCAGTLIDDGGLENDYSSDYTSYLTIQRNELIQYKIEFLSFSTEPLNDELTISLWGPNTSGYEVINVFSGDTIPPVLFYDAYGIRFSFKSNADTVGEGFAITWDCNIDNSVPPKISPAVISGECGYEFDFLANVDPSISVDGINWNFGDLTFSSEENPSHTYSNPGEYLVTCVASNFSGSTSDSIIIIVEFDEIEVSGPLQRLPNQGANFEATSNGYKVLVNATWRINGTLVAAGLTPQIFIAELGIHEINILGIFSDSCMDRDTFLIEIVDEISSVPDIKSKEIHLFPNPAKNYFQINNLQALKGDWHIYLLNNLGQIVSNYQNLNNKADNFHFALPNLESGLYYLDFSNQKGERFVKKLVLLR